MRRPMDLQGQFLIAMPQLLDPNFRRSVVLMLEHSEEGSLGLVINQTGQLTVGSLVSHLEVAWTGDDSVMERIGGPVQPEVVWMLHGVEDSIPGSKEVMDGCWFTTSKEGLDVLAATPHTRRRVLRGYSGWAGGQLEAELRQGSWLTRTGDLSLVFSAEPESVWEMALRGAGIDPMALVPGVEELQ